MRGPKPLHKIVLVESEERELQKLAKAHNSPYIKVLRAKIILDAHFHSEWSNQQIAVDVGCTDREVRKWRKRWNESKSLDDLPRPGAPKRFPP